jgi:hypothetical protein
MATLSRTRRQKAAMKGLETKRNKRARRIVEYLLSDKPWGGCSPLEFLPSAYQLDIHDLLAGREPDPENLAFL